MRRNLMMIVTAGLVLAFATVTPAVGAGAAKSKVTGCTAVTPANLEAVFGAPFQPGVNAGPMYLAGTCAFDTVDRVANAGHVSLYVSTGANGVKEYAARQKALSSSSEALTGIGKKAFQSTDTSVPTKAVHEVGVLTKRGFVSFDVWLDENGVDGVSQEELTQLATLVAKQL